MIDIIFTILGAYLAIILGVLIPLLILCAVDKVLCNIYKQDFRMLTLDDVIIVMKVMTFQKCK